MSNALEIDVSDFVSDDAFLVRASFGVFQGRLGLAVESNRRWKCAFGTGEVFFDVNHSQFEVICTLGFLRRLLSEFS